MRKIIFVLLVIVVFALLFAIVIHFGKRQVDFKLLDTVSWDRDIPYGQTVCNQESKSYNTFGLDKYGIDFNKYCVLITSNNVTKVEKNNKGFITITANGKINDVNSKINRINLYLLKCPDLFFDDRAAPESFVIFE